jgi:hypothetical protein
MDMLGKKTLLWLIQRRVGKHLQRTVTQSQTCILLKFIMINENILFLIIISIFESYPDVIFGFFVGYHLIMMVLFSIR